MRCCGALPCFGRADWPPAWPGSTAEEVERAALVVNKLRRKWQPFASASAPPAPPGARGGAGAALAAEVQQAEALLEEEAEWEASEEQEEKEGKLSDEAGLVGGLRRALLRVRLRMLTAPLQRSCSRASRPQRRPLTVVAHHRTPPAAGDAAAQASAAQASAHFRVMHTHQRCAAPVADSAAAVFLFEAACAGAGVAAGALIAVRKRRAALALAQRAGLPRPGGLSCL